MGFPKNGAEGHLLRSHFGSRRFKTDSFVCDQCSCINSNWVQHAMAPSPSPVVIRVGHAVFNINDVEKLPFILDTLITRGLLEPSSGASSMDGVRCKPNTMDYIHEEVFDAAKRTLGAKVGIGKLNQELKVRNCPELCTRLQNMNRARRSSAHPDVALASDIECALRSTASQSLSQTDAGNPHDELSFLDGSTIFLESCIPAPGDTTGICPAPPMRDTGGYESGADPWKHDDPWSNTAFPHRSTQPVDGNLEQSDPWRSYRGRESESTNNIGVKDHCAAKSESHEFSAWELLGNMAAHPPDVVNCGGSLLTPGMAEPVVGESLLTAVNSSRAASACALAQLNKACADTSWMLKSGDIVFWRDDQIPSIVMRVGYGSYEREVRIAFVNESLNLRGVGRWVSSADCYKLDPGDNLVATTSVVDASEERREIPAGAICKFCGFDEDGDLIVCMGAGRLKSRRISIFREELLNFSLQ